MVGTLVVNKVSYHSRPPHRAQPHSRTVAPLHDPDNYHVRLVKRLILRPQHSALALVRLEVPESERKDRTWLIEPLPIYNKNGHAVPVSFTPLLVSTDSNTKKHPEFYVHVVNNGSTTAALHPRATLIFGSAQSVGTAQVTAVQADRQEDATPSQSSKSQARKARYVEIYKEPTTHWKEDRQYRRRHRREAKKIATQLQRRSVRNRPIDPGEFGLHNTFRNNHYRPPATIVRQAAVPSPKIDYGRCWSDGYQSGLRHARAIKATNPERAHILKYSAALTTDLLDEKAAAMHRAGWEEGAKQEDEMFKDFDANPDLTPFQRNQLMKMLYSNKVVFQKLKINKGTPLAKDVEFRIDTGDAAPIKQQPWSPFFLDRLGRGIGLRPFNPFLRISRPRTHITSIRVYQSTAFSSAHPT